MFSGAVSEPVFVCLCVCVYLYRCASALCARFARRPGTHNWGRLGKGVSVSVCVCLCLPVCPCLSVSVRGHLCMSMSVCIAWCMSVSVCVCMCLYVSASMSMSMLSLCRCLCLCRRLLLCLCLCASVCVSFGGLVVCFEGLSMRREVCTSAHRSVHKCAQIWGTFYAPEWPQNVKHSSSLGVGPEPV